MLSSSSDSARRRTGWNILAIIALGMLCAFIIMLMVLAVGIPIWLYISGITGLIHVGVGLTAVGLSMYMLREIIYRFDDEWNIAGDANGE